MLLIDEEKLVTLAIKGDYEAFEQLIENYSLPLSRFVTRLLGNSEDARDAIQQVLLQTFQKLPTLHYPANFRAWFFTIARNKCFEVLRRRDKSRFSPVHANEISPPGPLEARSWAWNDEENDESSSLENMVPDPGPLPLEIIERQETRQTLKGAINRLPVRERQVVILRYTTDLTFGEIAQVLATNENTVKTLFQRGKARLRTYLAQKL